MKSQKKKKRVYFLSRGSVRRRKNKKNRKKRRQDYSGDNDANKSRIADVLKGRENFQKKKIRSHYRIRAILLHVRASDDNQPPSRLPYADVGRRIVFNVLFS